MIVAVKPLPPRTSRGGTQPGHAWVIAAPYDLKCDGVTPFDETVRYARDHTEIRRGDRFLRKLWIFESARKQHGPDTTVTTRHCRACAVLLCEETDT